MLIRFVVDNMFSFGKAKEFNMIPRPRYRALNHHKYTINNFEVLKMTSIYGANGAGKSNLVKSLGILQDIITEEELPSSINNTKFKFPSLRDNPKQLFAVEFIQDGKPYYYALELSDGLVSTEELYHSGLGKSEDKLIFERKTGESEKTKISFFKEFELNEENKVLKSVIEKNLSKPNKPILKMLTTLDNEYLSSVKEAFDWFDKSLNIISPDSKPAALVHRIDVDNEFKRYAEDIMCTFSIGIKSLKPDKKKLNDFFDDTSNGKLGELIKELHESPKKMLGLVSRKGDELILVKEKDDIFVKQLKLEHIGKDGALALFDLEEESDGTIRLLDFIPAFQDIVVKNKVFVIDEIERSIHPLLIKELINKFSLDKESLGQLIFTTHESNLLDLDIFRQDEIWFAEKDKDGSTDLYSLSDFKEHNTIDIRKGYLNGRYGSIPFLANLKDLNWRKYDIEE